MCSGDLTCCHTEIHINQRGTLRSGVIAGGVKMKLLVIWFCGKGSMAKGVSEDKLAHLLICLR